MSNGKRKRVLKSAIYKDDIVKVKWFDENYEWMVYSLKDSLIERIDEILKK